MRSREQLLKEITELRKKVKELEKYELEFMNIAETLRRSEKEKIAILDAMFEFIVLSLYSWYAITGVMPMQ